MVFYSTLGHRVPVVPVPHFSVYPATKHALTALCLTLRQEIQYFKLNIKLTVSKKLNTIIFTYFELDFPF